MKVPQLQMRFHVRNGSVSVAEAQDVIAASWINDLEPSRTGRCRDGEYLNQKLGNRVDGEKLWPARHPRR